VSRRAISEVPSCPAWRVIGGAMLLLAWRVIGGAMLLSLAQWLQSLYPEQFGFLRVFQYITFRAVLAAMTA